MKLEIRRRSVDSSFAAWRLCARKKRSSFFKNDSVKNDSVKILPREEMRNQPMNQLGDPSNWPPLRAPVQKILSPEREMQREG